MPFPSFASRLASRSFIPSHARPQPQLQPQLRAHCLRSGPRIRLNHSFAAVDEAISHPLFQRIPPWWARWTWALIACDMFMTVSAIELTWNNWYELMEDLSKQITSEDKKALAQKPVKDDAAAATGKHWEARPTWQRGALCVAHLTFGVGVAVALLVTQTRFVKTFGILPRLKDAAAASKRPTSTSTSISTASNRELFLQSAHNWKRNGRVFPVAKCSLAEGRDAEELILRVAGERGHWHIGLHGAIVDGTRVSKDVGHAQGRILAAWVAAGGKLVGQWTDVPKGGSVGGGKGPGAGAGAGATVQRLDSRWKSGPVVRGL